MLPSFKVALLFSKNSSISKYIFELTTASMKVEALFMFFDFFKNWYILCKNTAPSLFNLDNFNTGFDKNSSSKPSL